LAPAAQRLIACIRSRIVRSTSSTRPATWTPASSAFLRIPDRAGPPGRRLSAEGCGRVVAGGGGGRGRPRHPPQLRHTYATAMVNANVSPESLMALLGHVSAEMSLHYGRLLDATVRAEYERALSQAKEACATDSRHLSANRHRLFRRPVTNPSLNTSAWVSWREVDLLQESRCYRRYAI